MHGIVTLLVVLTVLPMMAFADDFYAASAPVKVKVELIESPCVVNDERPIEVEFGDVVTTRVSIFGGEYKVPINYTLSCPENVYGMTQVQIRGNVADFDQTLLQTDSPGLAIRIEGKNGIKFQLNHYQTFQYPEKVLLWAVLVKNLSTYLKGGEFSAAATLAVSYE